MLTRGVATIAADMDTATGVVPTLIGAHDYCTQVQHNSISTHTSSIGIYILLYVR